MEPPKILPPHYFVLALVVMLGLGFAIPGQVLPGWWTLIGAVPVTLGIILAAGGARQFAKADTNIIPLTRSSALVTDGAFAFTRNPMYLGMLLALAGAALILNSPWPWLVIPPFWLIIRQRFVRHEEVLMEETFGQDYLDYKAQTRRWL